MLNEDRNRGRRSGSCVVKRWLSDGARGKRTAIIAASMAIAIMINEAYPVERRMAVPTKMWGWLAMSEPSVRGAVGVFTCRVKAPSLVASRLQRVLDAFHLLGRLELQQQHVSMLFEKVGCSLVVTHGLGRPASLLLKRCQQRVGCV